MDLRTIKEFLKDASVYIIAVIVIIFIIVYVLSLQQVMGPSMEHTLDNNDIVLLSKIQYKWTSIKREDVVVVQFRDTNYIVKRIIGLPGEHILIKDNKLYIDGNIIEEPYLKEENQVDFKLEDLGYETIPDDMYLALGDNRNESTDSRELGLITKDDILGKTFFRIWPINKIGLIN